MKKICSFANIFLYDLTRFGWRHNVKSVKNEMSVEDSSQPVSKVDIGKSRKLLEKYLHIVLLQNITSLSSGDHNFSCHDMDLNIKKMYTSHFFLEDGGSFVG